jgi:hypothetical protein
MRGVSEISEIFQPLLDNPLFGLIERCFIADEFPQHEFEK